jgi:flagellar basal body rod protein FlgG
MAIDGPGFFEVQLPNGTKAYTRDGEFQFNAQGQLVTKQGYPVLSDSGPITKDANSDAPLTVSATGATSQGDQPKGKLHIVEFAQPRELTSIGQGYYLANNPAAQPSTSTSSSVRQGCLESANTTPTVQMSSLIDAMRGFEAGQKVIQMQDERMGKIITDLSGA